MDSGQMHYGLGEEWMQMVVVNDFSTFDDPKGGTYLRRGPFPGLRCPDGNRVCAVVAGKSISLCRRYAEFPIFGII